MADSRAVLVLKDTNEAVKVVKDNDLIIEARKSFKEVIGGYTLTDDIRADKMMTFETTLALQALQIVLTIASESDVVEEKLASAKLEKLAGLAKLKKEYGYGNATVLDGLGVSTENGVVDYQRELTKKQVEGFLFDMMYKLNKNTSEMISMLAMNGVATPQWMSNIFRITAEAMSHGKVDIQVTANIAYDPANPDAHPQFLTSVAWRGDAELPNGI